MDAALVADLPLFAWLDAAAAWEVLPADEWLQRLTAG